MKKIEKETYRNPDNLASANIAKGCKKEKRKERRKKKKERNRQTVCVEWMKR